MGQTNVIDCINVFGNQVTIHVLADLPDMGVETTMPLDLFRLLYGEPQPGCAYQVKFRRMLGCYEPVAGSW